MTRKDGLYESSGSYLAKLEGARALMKAGLQAPDINKLLNLRVGAPDRPVSRILEIDPKTDSAQAERAIYEAMEQEFPDLWRVCYPRHYNEFRAGDYYSPKKPAWQMLTIAIKILSGHIGRAELYEYHLASHLTKYRMPMYWLGANMAEALKLTTPPGKFNWYEMPLPFPAAIFMMPKGSLVHATDGDVSFICYGRFRAQEEYVSPLFPKRSYMSGNGGMVLTAATQKGYFLHWNIPLDMYGPVLTLPELQELISKYSHDEHESGAPHVTDLSMTDADNALGLEVAQFIFSTLLLMTARPDLVINASLSHRVPAKKHRQAKEFWSPAIIGEHYRIRREAGPPQGGTHASPRFHWVKGFWKEQPYGPGRAQRKELWIEPYTRGGE